MSTRSRDSLCYESGVASWMLARIIITGIALMVTGLSAEGVDFAHEIVPVLKAHCGKCHHDEEKKGGFSMNTRAAILEGSENGEVITERSDQSLDGAASYFIEVLKTDDEDILMPPKGDRVPEEKIALLQKWIDAGMPWEPGFSFAKNAWEPPLRPQEVTLPALAKGAPMDQNPIDRLLVEYRRDHALPDSEPLGEEAFLRRVSLDLVGLLPSNWTPGERVDRNVVIDSLLSDDIAYADHWLTFWNDLLRNDYTGTGFITGGRKQITHWLYGALRENRPYDQFVRELLAPDSEAEGFINGIQWRGEVNSSQTREVQFSQNLSQVFLGINMKCASCHDSFIDRWKLEEAYSLAAIFADTPLEIHRCDKPTGEMAQARWIFPELGQIDPEAEKPERLRQLSKLVTHRENGRFSRVIVNRLWHRLMGRGIVHPVDAMETRPWSEPLLEWLAQDFVEHGYDLKHTLRQIVRSEAYQSTAVVLTEEIDNESYRFSGPVAKRLTAEQFVDAVWQLTEQAPRSQDAGVSRTTVTAVEIDAARPTGQWIWRKDDPKGLPAVGEVFTARTAISVEEGAQVVRASLVVTADNEYRAFLNNRLIVSGGDWTSVEVMDVRNLLRSDKPNWLMISAKNGGKAPNAAGLFAELHLRFSDGTERVIGTDRSWNYTVESPNERGQFAEKAEWGPATVVTGVERWRSGVFALSEAIAIATSEKPSPSVRASLIKSDDLLRSLGRPHREQVVTVRPENLSTLQAIDLANGQALAGILRQGSERLVAELKTSEEIVRSLYVSALTRLPSPGELDIGNEIIGPMPTPATVEDFLWALLMLPEFQIVR